ncbi:MAG: EF-hand domain-containing protein [Hyphomonas sp.]|nr:EF-hand domain-containing protein [Hyphomonas sp.]
MIRSFSLAALAVACVSVSAHAQAEEDELVRLPGQGELRDDSLRQRAQADRLKPGAGLFITFDTNNDGRISQAELDAGIPAAFTQADSNEDGYLTALEQQDWARSLPTRDDSLANPFRFDPNLDRRVDLDEFTLVISNLGRDYSDELSGDIIIADLKAPRPTRGGRGEDRAGARQDGSDRQRPGGSRSFRR